jgi:hypothetical protein
LPVRISKTPALDDDKEGGPSDERFRLDMAHGSVDQDIRERRAEIPEEYDEEEKDNE